MIRAHKRWDRIFALLGLLSMMIGILTLVALFSQMVIDGLPRLSSEFFTNFPSRRAGQAGILSAWVGSVLVMLVTAFFAVPLITYMMEDPRTISASIDLVFVAKAVERVGDHAKNLAEAVIYVPAPMSRILIVEDEEAIAELMSMNLRHAGHEVVVAPQAAQAQAALDAVLPDLVLLDWMLPGESGLSLARRWRGQARTRELPIIMVTARAAESDLIAGLDAGADDYLTKPFSPNELHARIRALLRRRAPEALEAAIELDGLRLDPATRRVSAIQDAVPVELRLGPTEFRLLHYLMAHPDRVHSRSQLLDKVWGDHVYIEERTVDVHVKRLRSTLEATGHALHIDTVRGAGYRW
ncbi:hypothetical protein B566_EDAN018712, partial [Ephemera danica]